MLFDGHTGERARLKTRAIRGVESAGMVLSERELGLGDDHTGILVLDPSARIGRPLVEHFGDVVFNISTWANRADQLGVLGMAREIAAMLDLPLREPDCSHGDSGHPVEDFVSVTIEDPDLCRRFTASIIEDVKLGPSPEWMQQRLLRHGMRPINNLVDITNYVMLETGQPLHAFDYDLVRGRRIVARRAKPGEHLVTLDGIDRALDPEMLVICDGEGPVGIAGVMGGGNSEVNERTRTILLEVANFHPGSIRRTSALLKLRTEASLRFEKGIGAEMAEYAQHRALHLYEQLAGGRVARGLVDVFPGRQPPPEIVLTGARVEQVLGIAVPAPDVTRILGALGFKVDAVADDTFVVRPPYWRPDVLIADDVIEEIIRIYGHDKLPVTMLRGTLPEPEFNPVRTMRERLRHLAVALGFQETINYTLTTREELAAVVPPDDPVRTQPLSVLNPVAAQHKYLRTSLRGNLLRNYASNRSHEDGALRLFEVGVEYLPVEADLPRERPVVCLVLGGPREGRWARAAGDRLDFFDLKGAIEAMSHHLRVDATFQPAHQFGLLPGHAATVHAAGEQVGLLGQLHPDTAAAFDIDEPVFLAELWVEELARVAREAPAYEPPSRFPPVRQDIAIIVDAGLPAGRVLQLVRAHRAGDVRLTADVFDEYRGPGIPDGKKSLALALRYQASDRTLTDEDVARIQQGLVTRLEKEFGARLRGG
ncbi:MAG: phenylalanine--tRNA ligase subunit beta [Dehalococcoidia bacterium]